MRRLASGGTMFVALVPALMAAPAVAVAQESGCPLGGTCVPAPEPVELPEPAAQWRASIEYGHVQFVESATSIDPWHTVSAEIARRGSGATVIGRANWARRFGEDGVQIEMDAYPRISPRFYAYLNAGFSGADIFPDYRLGGELYANTGAGTEASLGIRRLEFGVTGVTIYTGSAGIYRGNWYVSARPFVTPKDEGTSVSGILLVRRYFATAESYATLLVGAGSAPTEAPLEFEVRRADTRRIGAYGRTPLGGRLGLRWSAHYEHEELTRQDDRGRVSVGLGLETRL
ncbi:MAG TPA: YaiO family outer membrane beta-barrel protein [Longimicrobium sp.]|nr:YaiO family outer membrane beta-barrel protein [Longimicrobium sp.]